MQVNDPIKVRLKISQVHSQHGTQLLVRSQHGAPTCVRHKPRPEKYFENFTKFFRNKQSFLLPTAIYILTFQLAHVIEFSINMQTN